MNVGVEAVLLVDFCAGDDGADDDPEANDEVDQVGDEPVLLHVPFCE